MPLSRFCGAHSGTAQVDSYPLVEAAQLRIHRLKSLAPASEKRLRQALRELGFRPAPRSTTRSSTRPTDHPQAAVSVRHHPCLARPREHAQDSGDERHRQSASLRVHRPARRGAGTLWVARTAAADARQAVRRRGRLSRASGGWNDGEPDWGRPGGYRGG